MDFIWCGLVRDGEVEEWEKGGVLAWGLGRGAARVARRVGGPSGTSLKGDAGEGRAGRQPGGPGPGRLASRWSLGGGCYGAGAMETL
jgi:hypothetical protein